MISRRSLIIASVIGVAWVLLSYFTQRAGYTLISCPSRLLLDLPCAGCGGTRAFLLLVKGHPVDAFLMNPNVYLVVPAFAAAAALSAYDYVRHTDRLNECNRSVNRFINRPFVYIPLIVFELTVWAYNVWRYKHGML